MLVSFVDVTEAFMAEGLRAEGPDEHGLFCFYYSTVEEMVFVQGPDPDGMVDLDFTLEQVATWDERLAERLRTRLLTLPCDAEA